MKTDLSEIEPFRLQVPNMPATHPGNRWGMFLFRFGSKGVRCILDDGEETRWEHVSVTVSIARVGRMPTWEEMCWVKKTFWEPEEAVMELHPPASTYVNQHPHCLHLWRPLDGTIPLPPTVLVGIKL